MWMYPLTRAPTHRVTNEKKGHACHCVSIYTDLFVAVANAPPN